MQWRSVLMSAFLAVGAVASTSGEAEACLRQVRRNPNVDTRLQQVRQAERLAAAGKHERAVKLAMKAFPDVMQLSPTEQPFSLFDRAQRVAALAAVRTGGAVNLGRAARGRDEASKEANLSWATLALQYQESRYPDNVVVRAEYAEALAARPINAPAAYEILSDLAQKDIMPTARAYAVLAMLQAERGDASGHDLSLVRCQEIAGDGSSECKVA